MHARMTTIRTQPGKLAEAMDIARGSIAPHAKGQRGFKSLLALVDREDDEIVFVSLWETEEDMEAGERSGYYREQIGKFGGMLAGEVVREAYEVSIQA